MHITKWEDGKPTTLAVLFYKRGICTPCLTNITPQLKIDRYSRFINANHYWHLAIQTTRPAARSCPLRFVSQRPKLVEPAVATARKARLLHPNLVVRSLSQSAQAVSKPEVQRRLFT